MVKLKKKEKIELDEFLRGMVEAFNRRLNSIERKLNAKIERQDKLITGLERKMGRMKGKITSRARLKVDKSLLKDLGLPLEAIKPKKVSKPKKRTKTKKKS